LFVNITGNINAGEINVAVEVLRNTSTLLNNSAPGTVYKNINIWVGTSGFAVPRNIKEAAIRFKVENSWLDSNNFAASDVRMLRWDGNQWSQLETRDVEKNGAYTYYEAIIDSFSSFAISGLKSVKEVKAGMVTVKKTSGPIGTTNIPVITPIGKSPGFEAVLVLTVICGIYLLARKRR
jgi:PGF-pre-PGF domain-containing protein